MCVILDRIENRGIERGREEGIEFKLYPIKWTH